MTIGVSKPDGNRYLMKISNLLCRYLKQAYGFTPNDSRVDICFVVEKRLVTKDFSNNLDRKC